MPNKTAPWPALARRQDWEQGDWRLFKLKTIWPKKKRKVVNDGGGLRKWNHWRKHIHGGCATKYSQVRGYHNHRP